MIYGTERGLFIVLTMLPNRNLSEVMGFCEEKGLEFHNSYLVELRDAGQVQGSCLYDLQGDTMLIRWLWVPGDFNWLLTDGLARAAMNCAELQGARTAEFSPQVDEHVVQGLVEHKNYAKSQIPIQKFLSECQSSAH